MTAKQFTLVLSRAISNADLSGADMTALEGYALGGFHTVTVPLDSAARCLRWQCQTLAGGFDTEAIAEVRHLWVNRRRVDVAI